MLLLKLLNTYQYVKEKNRGYLQPKLNLIHEKTLFFLYWSSDYYFDSPSAGTGSDIEFICNRSLLCRK